MVVKEAYRSRHVLVGVVDFSPLGGHVQDNDCLFQLAQSVDCPMGTGDQSRRESEEKVNIQGKGSVRFLQGSHCL